MKRNSSKNADNSAKKHSGFTLVELVVVIAVLAILAGVGAVAYRGYIVYAKKGVDRQLVGEVKNAVSMEAQSDTAVLKLGVGDKAQAIGSIFISCPSKDEAGNETGSETSFSADPTGILEKALVSSCGENYASVLQLKYDGWKSDGNAAGGFVDENGERYMGAQKMMEQLYKSSSVIFDSIAKEADFDYGKWNGMVLNTVIDTLNEDGTITDILKQAGYDNGQLKGNATKNNMKNAAIWAVAKYTSDNSKDVKDAITSGECFKYNYGGLAELVVEAKSHGGSLLTFEQQLHDYGFDSYDPSVLFHNCLDSYVSLSMLVSYLDTTEAGKKVGENGIAAEVERIMNQSVGIGGTNGLAGVLRDIAEVQKLIKDNDNLKELADAYYRDGQAAKDAEAYVDMASHVHDMQDTYNNSDRNLKDTDYFTRSDFIQELKRYTGETNGILITAYSDGTTKVSPSDADPGSKNATDADQELAQGN